MEEVPPSGDAVEPPLKKRLTTRSSPSEASPAPSDSGTFNVAVLGCGHGELDKLYETLDFMKASRGVAIDLVICCGDFQAVRNAQDLQTLAVKPRYRRMNSFHKYYSGAAVAPILTLFVGGNHEASGHLRELYYGGWVAPNIYYMGASGVVQFGGLRIGGLSGIYKPYDYRKGYFELAPPFRGFSEDTMRSVYHTREYEVFKLMALSGRHLLGDAGGATGGGGGGDDGGGDADADADSDAGGGVGRPDVDVMVSHDWPRGIALHGNTEALLRRKSFLRREVESNTLGNVGAQVLLHHLKPAFWFSAHMHVKFPAIVHHPPTPAPAPHPHDPLDPHPHHRPHTGIADVVKGDEVDNSIDKSNSSSSIIKSDTSSSSSSSSATTTTTTSSLSGKVGLLAHLPSPKHTSNASDGHKHESFAMCDSTPPSVSTTTDASQVSATTDTSPSMIRPQRRTKFLALDKIRNGGDFLQVITMPRTGPLHLRYDVEWLAILRNTRHLLSFSPHPIQLPGNSSDPSKRHDFTPTAEELEWVRSRAAAIGNENLDIPQNFVRSAIPHESDGDVSATIPPDGINPQHKEFLEFLQIEDPFHIAVESDAMNNEEEIDLDIDCM